MYMHIEFADGQIRDIAVSEDTALVIGFKANLAPAAALSFAGVEKIELVHADLKGDPEQDAETPAPAEAETSEPVAAAETAEPGAATEETQGAPASETATETAQTDQPAHGILGRLLGTA